MSKLLDDFLEEVKKQDLNINYVKVIKNGETIIDYSRLDQKTRLNTWSACKSIVAVAVGIAMDEGIMTLDEKLVDTFPEYVPMNADKSLLDLTVRDMLTMTTGVENALFFGDDPDRYTTKDWIGYFFSQKFPIENNTRFLYCNFNTYMLSCMIEKKTGMGLKDWLTPRFFSPLMIGNPDWTTCPMGHAHAANGLYLTIDELARFGELILNKGVYNGVRVVSEKFIEEATKNQMPETEKNVKYGYQFWIKDGYFGAFGKYGQRSLVVPDKNAVVAVQSLESKDISPVLEEYIIKRL
ncbi:MAG: serine hydrolase [Lachnospiraceae bacterium]|nr:serine hydrolase [Lachnospiraceae bacterium]